MSIDQARKLYDHCWKLGSKNNYGEGQRIISDIREASETLRDLSALGQEVRCGLISSQIYSEKDETVNWLVSRPGGNEWTHRINEMFEGEAPATQLNANGYLKINRERYYDLNNPNLEKDLWATFGWPVSPHELVFAFTPDVLGYHLEKLHIMRQPGGIIALGGVITTESGELAAVVHRELALPPWPGEAWVAKELRYNADGIPECFKKKGNARSLHQRFFGLLYRHGVDYCELQAADDGLYVWPHLGFDCAHPDDLNRLKHEFKDYLLSRGLPRRVITEANMSIKHLWDIGDFQHEGDCMGKEFLLAKGKTRRRSKLITLRFYLSPDYPGWQRLFKRAIMKSS